MTNNFCLHNLAQKWLARLLPSTPYLPHSGPFRLVRPSQAKPKLKNFAFPHSHIPIPRLGAFALYSHSTFWILGRRLDLTKNTVEGIKTVTSNLGTMLDNVLSHHKHNQHSPVSVVRMDRRERDSCQNFLFVFVF